MPELNLNFIIKGTCAIQLITCCYVFLNYLVFNWLNSIGLKGAESCFSDLLPPSVF